MIKRLNEMNFCKKKLTLSQHDQTSAFGSEFRKALTVEVHELEACSRQH